MHKELIEEADNGFRYEKVYTCKRQHARIQNDKEGYKNAVENAKSNTDFSAVVEWYEGRDEGLSDHEALVKKKFIALQGEKNPDGSARLHSDIAKIAGCSKQIVGNVLNSRDKLTKPIADNILKNLHKAEKVL